MKEFEKIKAILDSIEDLIDKNEFEITDENCSQLYNDALEELNNLDNNFGWNYDDFSPLDKEGKALKAAKERFKELSSQFETPTEFLDSMRSMRSTNEDEDEDVME